MSFIKYIGIDPDTTTTGIGYIMDDGTPEVVLLRAKGRYMDDRYLEMSRKLVELFEDLADQRLFTPGTQIAIEGQHIRYNERNPKSILGLQTVVGMAIAAVSSVTDLVYVPIPSKWKGSVPKEVHHRRILRELGVDLDDAMFHGIAGGQKQHVVDALGMALWLKRGRSIS